MIAQHLSFLTRWWDYTVGEDDPDRTKDIKASVSLTRKEKHGNMLYGLKYFADPTEAKIFTKVIGEFMSEGLREFGLQLACNLSERELIWPFHLNASFETQTEDFDITSFSQFNEDHRANACCELSTDIFVKAVELARAIDWGKDSLYDNNWEAHPAIKLVCDWWNSTVPNPELRCAASFSFCVRVDNGSNYLFGCRSMHCNSIDPDGECSARRFSSCNARLGDILLFTFEKGKAGYIPSLDLSGKREVVYFDTYLVNGEGYIDRAGESLEDADDSRDTLNALENFPENFPKAWAMFNH